MISNPPPRPLAYPLTFIQWKYVTRYIPGVSCTVSSPPLCLTGVPRDVADAADVHDAEPASPRPPAELVPVRLRHGRRDGAAARQPAPGCRLGRHGAQRPAAERHRRRRRRRRCAQLRGRHGAAHWGAQSAVLLAGGRTYCLLYIV